MPGTRFIGKPVFLLTSTATFSAGEGLASILQARKRAIVVGEKTDGGAHPGVSYRIHPNFEAFIPVGRAFDPLTGKDLEGIGVTPDIRLPHEHAFLAAYHKSLEGVLASFDEYGFESQIGLAKEVKAALKELDSSYQFCSKCGYQNPVPSEKCKNCGEAWILPSK